MDEAFAEPLLQLKDTLEDDRLIAVTAWKLSIFRPEDRNVFDWITRSIDRVEDEWEKLSLIEALLRMKIPENVKWAENYAKRKEHPQHFKISIRNRIKEATEK